MKTSDLIEFGADYIFDNCTHEDYVDGCDPSGNPMELYEYCTNIAAGILDEAGKDKFVEAIKTLVQDSTGILIYK